MKPDFDANFEPPSFPGTIGGLLRDRKFQNFMMRED